jgi:hypothetical protein
LLRGAGEPPLVELTAVPPKVEPPAASKTEPTAPPTAPTLDVAPTFTAAAQEPTAKPDVPATTDPAARPAPTPKVEASAKVDVPRPTATTSPKPTPTGETPFFR